MLALVMIIAGCSLQAQVIRPVDSGQGSGGGIWLSGPGITGDGTGIHSGETPVLLAYFCHSCRKRYFFSFAQVQLLSKERPDIIPDTFRCDRQQIQVILFGLQR